MVKRKTRQIFTVGLTLVIIAVIIAALVSLARIILFPSSTTTSNDTSITSLLSTSTDRAVRMTVRGPLTADENYRSYQITITPSARNLTTYKGYLDQAAGSIALTNNIPAYEQFVYALNNANFMKGTELTGVNNDTRGICSTGYVYQFEILQSNKTLKKLWATLSVITKLFTNQIPKSNTLIADLWQ
jgi:hypothetical protein